VRNGEGGTKAVWETAGWWTLGVNVAKREKTLRRRVLVICARVARAGDKWIELCSGVKVLRG
jgi:hypothetical protein